MVSGSLCGLPTTLFHLKLDSKTSACHLERRAAEIPPAALLRSSIPLRSTQNDSGGSQSKPEGNKVATRE